MGGLARGYFIVMSTAALAIGLIVGNILKPGAGLQRTDELAGQGAKQAGTVAKSTSEFLLDIIPTTLFSALTGETVLQTLLVAALVGFALQAMP